MIDKLGVKADSRVALIGIDDSFLEGRTKDVSKRRRKDCDLVFFNARTYPELKKIAALRACIKPTGAIWVLREKGGEIKDIDVIQAGLEAKMVDNKIASFSDTLSAMRLVIRIKDR